MGILDFITGRAQNRRRNKVEHYGSQESRFAPSNPDTLACRGQKCGQLMSRRFHTKVTSESGLAPMSPDLLTPP